MFMTTDVLPLSLNQFLWLTSQFIFDSKQHSPRWKPITDVQPLSLDEFFVSSLTQFCHFPTERKWVRLTPNNIPLMTTDHWADISTFTQWISVSQLTACLSIQNLKAAVPCRNPWVTWSKQQHFPRNKHAIELFPAGWELDFLMEHPFGWIWQEPILTNTGNEGTFTLFLSVFSLLAICRIQNFCWYWYHTVF